MADYIAALSAEYRGNWQICKRERLWGASQKGGSHGHGRQVHRGDRIFIWQSGEGLLAMCRATADSYEPTSVSEVPWPEPERYGWLMPIEVVAEMGVPIVDEFLPSGNGRVSRRFGLEMWRLRGGFEEVTREQGDRLAEPFGVASTTEGRPEGDTPEREPIAAVFLQPASSLEAALLALYRRRDECEHGELLVVGQEADRPAFEREVENEPFAEIRECVRFVTREELADELRHATSAGGKR
jgi:hypothetical protein